MARQCKVSWFAEIEFFLMDFLGKNADLIMDWHLL